jgi:hypothetical protein
MVKKFAKVLIVLVMLIGLAFSVINFVAPNQAYAVDDQPNGRDVAGNDGNAYDCDPGGDSCVIVTAPPIN